MSRIFQPGGPTRFAHQSRGLQKMISTGGKTALLFDPGLGKTATVLDYASLLALKSPAGEVRVLVVCPLAAVDTWVQQAELFVSPQVHVWSEALGGSLIHRGEAMAARGGNPYPPPKKKPTRRPRGVKGPWAPRAQHAEQSWAWYARASDQRPRHITRSEGPDGLGQDKPRLVLIVVNIDTFTSRATHGGGTMADYMVQSVRRFDPELVVVDESHKIKSSQGNASRLLARLTHFVPRRVILTGTVMPHSPMDVFGQWRFLDPYAFGTTNSDGTQRQATFGSFRSRYAVMGGFMGREVTGFRNLDEMQEIMARNACVARKEDALDLPPTMDVTVPVELSPGEKKAYKEMKDSLAATLLGGNAATVPNRLSQMLRLRQITSGYLPDDQGTVHVLGASKTKTIRSIVHDNLAGEKRIVIFALFTHEIEMLVEALKARDTEVAVITGATPAEERMGIRHRFGSDDPARIVLVAQIKTLSLAVNELVTANHCIFASLSQQRDDLIQARDRLNRIGQTRPVTFWYALAPGTVDMVIMQSHRDRTNLENAMLKHIAGDEEKEDE